MLYSVKLSAIVRDPQLQLRAKGLDENHVAEITEAVKAGKDVGPIKAMRFDKEVYPYDGWHRIEAHTRAGKDKILAEIEGGSLDDARLKAAAANSTHGLKRTSEDKRNQILAVLKLPESKDWSDRKIAEYVGVGHQLVADTKASQVDDSSTSNEEPEQKTVLGRDGKRYKKPTKPSKSSTKKASKKASKKTETETKTTDEEAEQADASDPHDEVNSFLRSIASRIKTTETTAAALSEELGAWVHKTKTKKLPTGSALAGSLRTCANTLKAVSAAVRDAVIEPGPCVECNGKGGACKGCNGDGYQSVEERRNSHNRRVANAPRSASA